MTKKHDNRDALKLSDAYWRDAQDYLQRYQFTVNSEERDYWGIKSRRMKAYIDLRFAIETILKSKICLSTGAGLSRDDLLSELLALGHNVGKLVQRSGLALTPELGQALAGCERAPVHWRYEAEAREARDQDERDYYATVGDDPWMRKLETFVEIEVKAIGLELQSYSRIVSGSELLDEIMARPKGKT